jgi:hypothetical protein
VTVVQCRGVVSLRDLECGPLRVLSATTQLDRLLRRQRQDRDIHFRGASTTATALCCHCIAQQHKMESSGPGEIASTLQSASIKRHPSPRHDLNPSTVASQKQPVTIDPHADPDAHSDVEEDEIPISVLDPVPRKQNMPPLPDLRFEQSYLKSIEHAESWKDVLWITLKDQV